MKTNIIIQVTYENKTERCRVKLDSKKFPYIVINNEKIILKSAVFPRTVKVLYGYVELHMEMVKGQAELETALSNPDLTADKLSIQQRVRIG